MAAPEVSFDDYLAAQGLIFRAELSYAAIAAAGFAYTGVTTGADEVVILQRAYSSSDTVLTVELFEATYTAGAAARTLNRRFSNTDPLPATIMQGVTPGTLGTPITAVTLRAVTGTGTAALQITGDDSHLYLKPNTSYVVRYTNGGSQAATISNGFDFRRVLKGGAWDKNLSSM